jgi:hypothetical protein
VILPNFVLVTMRTEPGTVFMIGSVELAVKVGDPLAARLMSGYAAAGSPTHAHARTCTSWPFTMAVGENKAFC